MMDDPTTLPISSRRARALFAGAVGLALSSLPFACTDDDQDAPDSGVDAAGVDAVADVNRTDTSIAEDTSTGTDAATPDASLPDATADASTDADANVVTDASDADGADAAALARIVYLSGANIWVMDPDGSNKTNLTNTSAVNYGYPAWSPDRSKIAFHSDKDDGSGEIYVMNADGSNVVRLTNSVDSDVQPTWSPDGTKIAFASRRDLLISSIYAMNAADGSNVVRVTNALPGSDEAPSWSSTNRIAFWTNEGAIGLHIAIVDVNPSVPFDAGEAGTAVWGTGRTGLLANIAYGLHPSWSPDGMKIVYSAGAGTRHIGVMNPDGTGQVDLTGGLTAEDHPAFSPDGTKITFDRNVSGKVLIMTMNANGSNELTLTPFDAGGGGTNPGW